MSWTDPHSPFQRRARAVPNWIRIPVILVPFGVTGYWFFTDSGLYALLADFQASLFDGEHYLFLSVLLPLLALMLPAVLVIHALGAWMLHRQDAAIALGGLPPSS